MKTERELLEAAAINKERIDVTVREAADPITLTRGECIAIALVLQTRERKGAPEVEAALASVEKKLAPMTADMWNKAFDDLLKATQG